MVRRGLKSRYVRRTKSGKPYYNIGQVVRDLSYVKRSLNTERKQYSFVSGTKTSSDDPTVIRTIGTLSPKDDTPLFAYLPLPMQGTSSYQRVGNQIKLTHISAKIRLEAVLENWHSTGQRLGTPYAHIMIGFYKPGQSTGSSVPTIADLFEKDSLGLYTRASYRNSQTYKQFYFPKGCSKYITLNPSGIPPSAGGNANHDTVVEKYLRINEKLNITIPFITGQSGTAGDTNWSTAEGMRPFMLIMTNCEGDGTDGKTYLNTASEIKFSYVDN